MRRLYATDGDQKMKSFKSNADRRCHRAGKQDCARMRERDMV